MGISELKTLFHSQSPAGIYEGVEHKTLFHSHSPAGIYEGVEYARKCRGERER